MKRIFTLTLFVMFALQNFAQETFPVNGTADPRHTIYAFKNAILHTDIKEFCKKNYGVTFPMAAKISVKGDDQNAIYKWLCNKSENGVLDAEVKWNFNKFLLDEKGKLLNYFPSKVEPMSEEITGKL